MVPAVSLPVRSSTPLANWRRVRGLRQDQLAGMTGISVATLRRLESGQMDNPPLRYLQNLAIALRVDLDILIEPAWREMALVGGDVERQMNRREALFQSEIGHAV